MAGGRKWKMGKALRDRISSLPDDIRYLVLDNLPVPDMVRTSVLSKEWRDCWTNCKVLDFGGDFLFRYVKPGDYSLQSITDYVLLCQKRPIEKFHLHLSALIPGGNCLDFNPLIKMMSENGIKHLSIGNTCGFNRHVTIPLDIFACSDLQRLELGFCKINSEDDFNLDDFIVFRNFIKLQLVQCVISDEMLKVMISNSPLLEELKLCNSNDGTPVLINASQLKTLDLNFNYHSRPVHLEKCPNLIFAEFMTNSIVPLGHMKTSNFDQFFHHMPLIRLLRIRGTALMSLAAGGIPSRLSAVPQYLESVLVQFLDMASLDQLSSSLCLIRSSPSLHLLEFVFKDDREYNEEATRYLKSQQTSGIRSQIRTVVLHNLEASELAVLFILKIMECCPILNMIEIAPSEDIEKDDEVWLFKELINLPRSSLIQYHDPFVSKAEALELRKKKMSAAAGHT